MDGLVGILSLGVGAGTWWWLAGRMKKSGSGWLTRQVAGIFACCFMAVVVVTAAVAMGIIESNEPGRAKPQVVTTKKEAAIKHEVKTLHMSPSEYAIRINAILKKYEKPYQVDPADITVGEVQDVLRANLGPYTSLIAAVSKETGEIVDVTLIGAGNGTPSSGIEIMLIASAALAAAAPESDHREVFRKLSALMDGEKQTYGEVQLSVKSTKTMGNWFMASPL